MGKRVVNVARLWCTNRCSHCWWRGRLLWPTMCSKATWLGVYRKEPLGKQAISRPTSTSSEYACMCLAVQCICIPMHMRVSHEAFEALPSLIKDWCSLMISLLKSVLSCKSSLPQKPQGSVPSSISNCTTCINYLFLPLSQCNGCQLA